MSSRLVSRIRIHGGAVRQAASRWAISHFAYWIARRRVQQGPFRGLRYIPNASGSSLSPKLLGCYEIELAPIVAGLLEIDFDALIDVGAAEGYYAVGFARFSHNAPVVTAFEIDPLARRRLRQLARRNGVANRVEIRGAADSDALDQALRGATRPFVLVDVEGYERELLNPERVPGLRISTLLIEAHEFTDKNLVDLLCERFAPTHELFRIEQQPRGTMKYAGHWLGRFTAFVNEDRDHLSTPWLFLRPIGSTLLDRALALCAHPISRARVAPRAHAQNSIE